MYKVSIIIPYYNSVNSLEKLLISIPNNSSIEIIVIDDKSTSKLKEFSVLKKKYQNKNIKFLNNNTNKKGAGVCRNIGLENATGEWLLFADSDDYFLSGMYETISQYFSSKVDIVYFKPTSLDAITGKISDRHLQYENLIDNYLSSSITKNENYLRYKFYVPWSKLIRRKLIEKNNIKFDEVIASNDMMFSAKIGFYADEILVSKKIIYCVLKEKGSLTTKIDEYIFDVRLNVWINYYNYLKEVLNENDFEELNLANAGRTYLVRAIKYKFGIRKIMAVYFKLLKNNIHVINKSLFKPSTFFKKITYFFDSYKREKQFYDE